jgi:hypothetical protein
MLFMVLAEVAATPLAALETVAAVPAVAGVITVWDEAGTATVPAGCALAAGLSFAVFVAGTRGAGLVAGGVTASVVVCWAAIVKHAARTTEPAAAAKRLTSFLSFRQFIINPS